MLKELLNPRQIPGELPRRWYNSPQLDLIIWQAPGQPIASFQLCYDKEAQEKALTWQRGVGLSHAEVSAGEPVGQKQKESPILIGNGRADLSYIARQFLQESAALPPEVAALVAEVLQGSRPEPDSSGR